MTWILLIAAALLAISFAVMAGSAIVYVWTDSDLVLKVGMTAIIAVLTMALLVKLAVGMMSV